jgi:hypothetical protein
MFAMALFKSAPGAAAGPIAQADHAGVHVRGLKVRVDVPAVAGSPICEAKETRGPTLMRRNDAGRLSMDKPIAG